MKIFSAEDVENGSVRDEVITAILEGKIVVYPTDTIYGIGCEALNSAGALVIREIKNRDAKPFSVIVPSVTWIRENCVVDEKAERWLEKLPGAYTLILKLKNKKAIATEVNAGGDTLGVRIPDHWIADIVRESGVPLITTSVNISGEKPLSAISEINNEIGSKIDCVIDEGSKEGKPSTVVDLSGDEEKILRR